MRPAYTTVDAVALKHNLNVVKAFAPKAEVVAMVKANAYGHGVKPVCQALQDKVSYFGVACLEEAVTLRECGFTTPILLIEGFFSKEELDIIAKLNMAIVIHNQWQLSTLLAYPSDKKFDVWLKFDTGMNRLGFSDKEVGLAFAKLSSSPVIQQPIKCMTHFACADELDNEFTLIQLKRFFRLANQFKAPVSLANSAGILAWPDSHGDYVRPGILLYGASPIANKSAASFNLHPVMSLYAHVIAIRQCEKGDSVGYGAIWRSDKKARIACVACGYGDGYPRHLSKDAYVLLNGEPCPIVGRISMDTLSIDVTHMQNVKLNDRVTLWGKGLPAEQVAKWADTISYELLCRAPLRVNLKPENFELA